ncbi:MAG TPA: NADH-quinone oxidoreductase subunit C [Dehalococcoidia bacterium]|nr:NADH-quinone oxidoreductase subunit C [Dehalococcoidia bacterium]
MSEQEQQTTGPKAPEPAPESTKAGESAQTPERAASEAASAFPPGTIYDLFREALPDVAFQPAQGARDVILTIDRADLICVCRAAKEDPRLDLKFLRFVTAVDHMEEGMDVVYQLWSYTHRHGVTLKTRIPADDLRVPSVTHIWKGANWHEREAAEMFGIVFEGHPNLVPLLLPEDMTDHHPLRKDVDLAPIEEWQAERLEASAAEGVIEETIAELKRRGLWIEEETPAAAPSETAEES